MTSHTHHQSEVVYLGGGCFWCTEAAFQKIPGVIHVTPGYAGGHTTNPTYEAVCTGRTGHAEVVKVEFDPHQLKFSQLLNVFFTIHDPTTLNRQGNDIGTQYRSIILYTTITQKEAAEPFLKNTVTELIPFTEFYEAEEYHHNYYNTHPDQAYCQVIIRPKLAKLKKMPSIYLHDQ